MDFGRRNFCCVGWDLTGLLHRDVRGLGPSHVLPYLLLLSCKHILHYFDHIRKQFFIVLNAPLLWNWKLGGLPRSGSWWVSMGEHKAGSKVGSAPWQFPADGLARPDSWPPAGIAVALMVCGP